MHGDITAVADVVVAQWCRGAVVYFETGADRLGIVVGAARHFATLEQALGEHIVGDLKTYHGVNLFAAVGEHLLEFIGLMDRAGEAVEDESPGGGGETVDLGSEDANHQIIGNKVAMGDVAVSNLAKLGSLYNLAAKHLACGYMGQTVTVNEFLALGPLATAGASENYKIKHFYLEFKYL